ncbi:hypothetical protein ACFYVL_37545 [Streptomyces sp. NPDC004111]|uniref:hypothetical protein n=1 Tax=Streptomyces sp. NPDC004111 TaxID=3364690 RepID=UPI0036B227AC
MTPTPMLTPLTGGPARPVPLPRARRALRVLAVVSCLPYLALKVVWISGGHLGIPAESVLLARPGIMAALNGLTVLMDVCVIVLALLLTQRWGRRVPAVLLALPMWVATGLLAPIATAFPVQMLADAFSGGGPATANQGRFLDEWVFGVVYGGFALQAVALGGLFVPYAKERWGHLWQGRVGGLAPRAAGVRTAALGVAALAVAVAVPLVLRAAGAGAEFTLADGASGREALSADARIVSWAHAGFALLAAGGLLVPALRLGRGLPLKVPLAAAWVGSGVLGGWGAWLVLSCLVGGYDGTRPPMSLTLTYAVQMITGFLALGCTAALVLRRRTP